MSFDPCPCAGFYLRRIYTLLHRLYSPFRCVPPVRNGRVEYDLPWSAHKHPHTPTKKERKVCLPALLHLSLLVHSQSHPWPPFVFQCRLIWICRRFRPLVRCPHTTFFLPPRDTRVTVFCSPGLKRMLVPEGTFRRRPRASLWSNTRAAFVSRNAVLRCMNEKDGRKSVSLCK